MNSPRSQTARRRNRAAFIGRRLPVALAIATLAAGLAGPADAVVVTWSGIGINNNWSSNLNWANGARPINGDSLIFQGSNRLANQNNITSLILKGITFQAGAGAFTLDGLAITSTGNFLNASSQVQTVKLGIRLGADQTWDGGSAGMAFNGAIDMGGNNSLTLQNGVTVNNANVTWAVAPSGTAAIHVLSGSQLNTGDAYIAGDQNNQAAVSATATVSGAGSTWSAQSVFSVGSSSATSDASLTISAGGQVSASRGRIGVYNGGGGKVTVTGSGSRWRPTFELEVGVEGSGVLDISSGATANTGRAWIGGSESAAETSGTGTINVDGLNSKFTTADFYVGYRGTGTLNVSNGGRVEAESSVVGNQPGSRGTVEVRGAQSVWANGDRLDIGGEGIGSLVVAAGGAVNNNFAFIGGGTSGAANASSVLVTGAGSTWASRADLFVNNGALVVDDGGVASAYRVVVGNYAQAGGSITVQGAGSQLNTTDWILLGTDEAGGSGGRLTLQDGGSATALGLAVGPQGTLDVQNGGLLTIGTAQIAGAAGISSGGRVNADTSTFGDSAGSVGTVSVSGAQSVWTNTGDLNVGGLGVGKLTVTAGGAVSNGSAYIGRDSTGAATASAVVVSGAGSTWASSDNLYVNNGSLLVDGGALVMADGVGVGLYARAGGSITVQGAGSQFNASNVILLATNDVGGPGGSLTLLAGGSVTTRGVQLGPQGSLNLAGGTLNLLYDSVNSTNSGTFTWTSGTLHFSGNASFADGTLLRNSTTLSTGKTLAVDGVLNLSDATVLTMDGGQLQGGTINLSGLATVGAGSTITTATRLSNFGSLQLAGGTLSGPGIVENTAEMKGYGRIDGSGGFTNSGLFTQAGGDVALSNTGQNTNLGTWNGLAGRQLVLGDTDLLNQGLIHLNGGFIVGNGGLVNNAQGTVSGSGRIDTNFFNQGTLAVDAGQTTITQSFSNRGQIFMGASSATLAGGQIGNRGLIQGYGKVSSNISNIDPLAVIEAQGGTLTLSGLIVSPNGGTLTAGSGAKLLITQGLASNAGQIQLAGGTFDNNNKALLNASNGVISGYGTLRSGTLTQSGQIQFSGGAAVPTSVYSSILATAGSKTILSGNSNATFYNTVDVQSGAELRISGGSVATFFGLVQQRSGALFTGTGTKRFEGGISVGASPGLGTDEGDVEFGDGNFYLAEVGGITACTLACGTNPAIANSSYDKYIVGGQLSLGGTLKLVSWNGFVAQAGQQFDLLDWGSVTGSFAAVDASGFTLAAGTTLDLSQLYTSGTVTVSAVPEPGSLALLLAGLLGVARIVNRRAKAAGASRT